jgi:general secretion pathway protein K
MPRRNATQRGFALLIVLWTLGLLALLITGLLTAGRMQTRIAENIRGSANAEAAADGAVQQAIFLLLRDDWPADSKPHALRIGTATAEVRAEDQAGKVNPNLSTVDVLASLLRQLGLDSPSARKLALAIIDWRSDSDISLAGGPKLALYRAAGLPYGTANRPFDTLEQLALVPGMTPQLFARLRPYMSVYQEGDAQSPATDTLAANAVAGAQPNDGSTGGPLNAIMRVRVLEITATAATRDGALFTRRAIVRLNADAQPGGAPWHILSWDAPRN